MSGRQGKTECKKGYKERDRSLHQAVVKGRKKRKLARCELWHKKTIKGERRVGGHGETRWAKGESLHRERGARTRPRVTTDEDSKVREPSTRRCM